MIHNKKDIHGLKHVADHGNYLMPAEIDDKTFLGGYAIHRPWHYVHKNTIKEMGLQREYNEEMDSQRQCNKEIDLQREFNK